VNKKMREEDFVWQIAIGMAVISIMGVIMSLNIYLLAFGIPGLLTTYFMSLQLKQKESYKDES